jgi:REP element-mobilizing transposase RayT
MIIMINAVGALRATPLHPRATPLHHATHIRDNAQMSVISPKPGTLSVIIRAYKSAVTKRIHEFGFMDDVWQRNYYEHVIRDNDEYTHIAAYIANNPQNWKEDDLWTN